MSLRTDFVLRALKDGANISEACREFGVSRKTGYKWIERYKAYGAAGLEDVERRPQSSPLRLDAEMTIEVLRIRDARPKEGPLKIRALLLRRYPASKVPSARTIARVLLRGGRAAPRRRRADAKGTSWISMHTDVREPNDLWTVDIKGWWRTRDQMRYEPLTVRDHHSRFVLCAQHVHSASVEVVRGVFEPLFKHFGLPKAILVDNGAPFISTSSRCGLTELSAWWVSLGIVLVRTRLASPQDNGGHERMHRDIAEQVEAFRALDAPEQQQRLDAWRYDFNHVRPHQALGMKTPAELYRPSSRTYDGPVELEYPDSPLVRLVQRNGRLWLGGGSYFVGKGLGGHRVGLQHTRDGRWLVNFAGHVIGALSPVERLLCPVEEQSAC